MELDLLAVVFGLGADHPAILGEKLGGAGVGEYRHTLLLNLGPELVHQLHGSGALRHQGALNGVTAEEEHVVFKFDLHVVAQPFGGVQSVGGQHMIQLGLAAGLRQVGFHLLDAVHAGLLQPVAGSGDLAAGEQRVAADVVHLFDEDDVRAGLAGLDRGGHACAARADDQHVTVVGIVHFGGLRFGIRGRQTVDAGLRKGVLDGADKCSGRKGRAGDSFHIHSIAIQHPGAQILHGNVAQTNRFFIGEDVNILESAVFDGDFNRYIAGLAALAGAGEGSVFSKTGDGCAQHHEREHQGKDLLHK